MPPHRAMAKPMKKRIVDLLKNSGLWQRKGVMSYPTVRAMSLVRTRPRADMKHAPIQRE